MENNECSLMWPEQYETLAAKIGWQRGIIPRNLKLGESGHVKIKPG
jgi:hypothetical protein